MGVYLQKLSFICIVTLAFLVSLYFPSVYADRGMIPIEPDVSVYEPGQKAIIAWNGQEEIMILSTDVSSSQETLVLEILPLPSNPTVEAASFQSFEEIQSQIWSESIWMGYYGSDNQARSGSVEVIFHDEIGAHNITVVKASDTSELGSWMTSFLENSGVNDTVPLGSFESVIEDYMNRGFRYYVLDLITVSPEEGSVDPILYRFNSDFLYYPLVITSPISGDTEITLFVLTEEKIEGDHSPFQKAVYREVLGSSKPIELVLSKGDLSKIDLRIGEIFQYAAWLNVLKYDGKASWLNKDLMVSGVAQTPEASISIDVSFLLILVGLSVFLGAASALVGVVVTLRVTKSKT